MYSNIYSSLRLLYPGGLETRRYLRELERTQWLSSSELEDWQFNKIKKVLKYAYEHVPFYRDLYKSQDINPEDIKSLKDFQRIPFLTKEDIINNLDSLVSPEWRNKVQLNVTGGSTGEPMQFYIEKSYHWREIALEFRCRKWYGVREGDKTAWVWGALRDIETKSRRSRLKAKILRHRSLNAFELTEPKMQAFAELLVRWKPHMLRVFASAFSIFAEYIKEHGITGIRPKLIECSAEKLTNSQRELIEEVFHCKAANWYSAREFATIAFECPEGGFHVCETRFLETVANGQVIPPGQMGEVVVTSLNQFAMPFIRYKIGDIAIREPNRCSCGRGLPVLREVVGKIQDILMTENGRIIHGGFFSHYFRLRPEIARYQVYQPDRNHLEVRLALRQEMDSAWFEGIRTEIQRRFGINTQVTIQVVNDFKLTRDGKLRYVFSDVKYDFGAAFKNGGES